MASTDARPIPRKNVAYRVTFPILDADGDLVNGAAGLDSEVSIDGGTFADCTNEATEIATSSGMYYLDLTSGEMSGDTVAVIVKTSTSGAKTTPIVIYPEELGDMRINPQTVWDALTSALTTASSIGKLLVDNVNAAISSRLASASYTAPDNAGITAILEDTNELQADWADGGRLDQILDDVPTTAEMGSAFTEIKGATFDTTDTLEAIRDRGDAAWLTAAGFSTHSAADVWAVATRVLTANTNLNDPSAAAIRAEIDSNSTALAAVISALSTIAGYLDTEISTLLINVAAILQDTGTDGVVISEATRQAIADEILKRGVAGVQDAASAASLAELILAMFESSRSDSTWTIRKTTGGTFSTRTLTTDGDAEPVVGVT